MLKEAVAQPYAGKVAGCIMGRICMLIEPNLEP